MARKSNGPHNIVPSGRKMVLTLTLVLASILLSLLAGIFTELPESGENEVQEFLGAGAGFAGIIIGAVALLVGWPIVGRVLLPGLGRWRVETHYWIAIAAVTASLVHGVGLSGLGDTRGWLSGWLAVAALVALFYTGWKRQALVRSWGKRTWRWVHWEIAVASLLLMLEHWALIEAMK